MACVDKHDLITPVAVKVMCAGSGSVAFVAYDAHTFPAGEVRSGRRCHSKEPDKSENRVSSAQFAPPQGRLSIGKSASALKWHGNRKRSRHLPQHPQRREAAEIGPLNPNNAPRLSILD